MDNSCTSYAISNSALQDSKINLPTFLELPSHQELTGDSLKCCYKTLKCSTKRKQDLIVTTMANRQTDNGCTSQSKS